MCQTRTLVKSVKIVYNQGERLAKEFTTRGGVPGRNVMAETEWGGLTTIDTNPTWRPIRDPNRKLSIHGQNPGSLSQTMRGAHAEPAAMQEAFDLAAKEGRLAELQGQTFSMTVVGKYMCRNCVKDIPLMAEKMGLSSMVISEKETGKMFYWVKGQTKLNDIKIIVKE